jgi:hydrogenase-4 membrane subunit HyfE
MMAFLLAILILSAFSLAVSGWIRGLFYISALQAWSVAAIVLLWRLKDFHIHDAIFILAYVMIKGVILPWFAIDLCRRVRVYRDDSPILSANLSLLLAIAFMVIAFSSSRLWSPDFFNVSPIFMSPALTLLMTGALLWVSRRLALTNLLAYFVITNALTLIFAALAIQYWQFDMVFLLGSTAVALAMGALTPYLKQEFDHIDVSQIKGQEE